GRGRGGIVGCVRAVRRARRGLSRRRADRAGEARRGRRRARPGRTRRIAARERPAPVPQRRRRAPPDRARRPGPGSAGDARGRARGRPAGGASGAPGALTPPSMAGRPPAALALQQLGQQAEARRLAAEEVELARTWGAPRALGAALRAAGVIEGGSRGIALLE